jgi:hypothetical protein
MSEKAVKKFGSIVKILNLFQKLARPQAVGTTDQHQTSRAIASGRSKGRDPTARHRVIALSFQAQMSARTALWARGLVLKRKEAGPARAQGVLHQLLPRHDSDPSSTSYVGTIQGCREVGILLRQDAVRRGLGRAQQVIYIGDGAT